MSATSWLCTATGSPRQKTATAWPFDESGLQAIIDGPGWASAKELAWATFAAVDHYSEQRRLLDDLTILAVRRLPPLPM